MHPFFIRCFQVMEVESTPWRGPHGPQTDQFWEEASPGEAGRCRLLKGVQTEESIGQQVLGAGVPGACGRKVLRTFGEHQNAPGLSA